MMDAEVVPKSEVPKLLRGCGRAPTKEDLEPLLEQVPEDVGDFSCFKPFVAWKCDQKADILVP